MFGWHAAEAIGRPITEMMPERYRQAHEDAVDRLRATGRTGMGGRTVYAHGLHKDGREVPISLYVKIADIGAGPVMSAVIRPAPPYGLPYVLPKPTATGEPGGP